jgi:hypothetical protein
MPQTLRFALRLFACLRVAARVRLSVEVDGRAAIDNASPLTPFREGIVSLSVEEQMSITRPTKKTAI